MKGNSHTATPQKSSSIAVKWAPWQFSVTRHGGDENRRPDRFFSPPLPLLNRIYAIPVHADRQHVSTETTTQACEVFRMSSALVQRSTDHRCSSPRRHARATSVHGSWAQTGFIPTKRRWRRAVGSASTVQSRHVTASTAQPALSGHLISVQFTGSEQRSGRPQGGQVAFLPGARELCQAKRSRFVNWCF
jgi:hypothetical protein